MPVLDVLFAMLVLFLFIAWFWLLISIIADIFSSDSSGWGKAGWILFVIIAPLLGCLVYLIVHGDDMQNRRVAGAVAADQAQRNYIRGVVGESPSTADELVKLKALRDEGTISDSEFQSMKAKLIAS